jgi:hypothetical protein
MNVANDEKEKADKGLQLPIKWNVQDHIITRFSTNMLVQVIENEFKLSFFEVKPPIRFKESDPNPSEVNADCVASVIVTADRLPNFIRALQDQLDKYNKRKEEKIGLNEA